MAEPEAKAAAQNKPGGVVETIKTVVYALVIAVVVRTVFYEPFNIPSGSMIPTLLVGDYLFISKFAYGYSHFSLPFGPHLWDGRLFGSTPHRGDVIVFKLPSDTSVDYIKRLVGLPGDRIQVIHGVLQINGKPVERKQLDDFIDRDSFGNVTRTRQYQETLPSDDGTGPGVTHTILQATDDGMCLPVPAYPNGQLCPDNTPVFQVPPGHYFMMGDNRDNSADSRFPPNTNEGVGYVPADNLLGKAEILFFSSDGSASLFEPWKWPFAIRWGQFFNLIH